MVNDMAGNPIADKPKSLPMALSKLFRLPGESLQDFQMQYHKLEEADRAWYRNVLEAELGWTF